MSGGQQNGGTPAAASPPQTEVGAQQAPLAHIVPDGQQMPPSQTCAVGQQVPAPIASPTHWVPDGQHSEPPGVKHSWVMEQHRPQMQTSPGEQHVVPQKFGELGVQVVAL